MQAPVRIRTARGFAAATFVLALGLPLTVAVTLIASVEGAWLPVAAVLLVGGIAVVATRPRPTPLDGYRWPDQAPEAQELLRRLCMRAGMVAPELIVEPEVVANAWTAGGRIYLTTALVELLDRSELEAVIAHEVAHLARRDAAVMEICSAPSRVLLAFAAAMGRSIPPCGRVLASLATLAGLWLAALLCAPVALAVGWISHLSVLASSRAREHAADAVAAALTGRPSALASALVKLEGEQAPSADLRRVAVLCIVGTRRRTRLLSTHPPTAARVRRLQRLEVRQQANPAALTRR